MTQFKAFVGLYNDALGHFGYFGFMVLKEA
jgi:hypothetical protein